MKRSLARRALLAAILAVSLHACSGCGTKALTGSCSSDADCAGQHGGDARWICDTTVEPHQCAQLSRECSTTADCCPGQLCDLSGHYCRDSVTSCSGDASCTAPGQVCKTLGVHPAGPGCTYEKCSASGACGAGTTCFNGYCVGSPPCGGPCSADPSGNARVCVTATGKCSPAPHDQGGTCQRSCGSGQMLVLHDPGNLFDTCSLSAESCDCVSLPPLVVRDVARHSSLALAGQSVYVSAYDGEHGDLVLHTFDKANLTQPSKSEWLDGVPATGALGGDPSGPRHGITTPGPDVGRYTSLAADASGNLFIAYYDVDNGDLKFLGRYDGAWSAPVTLDGTSASSTKSGDTGLYTSIALTSAGVPAITYFRRASYLPPPVDAETGLSTAVSYVIARVPRPQSRADWFAPIDVEQADRPAAPCNGACASGQACFNDGGTQRCAAPAATCAPACATGATCVQQADPKKPGVCLQPVPAPKPADVPQGDGLMTSLAFLDDRPVVAWYDSLNQVLKAAIGLNAATGANLGTPAFAAPVILDGQLAGKPRRDVGRWPSLAIGPSSAQSRIAISYQDVTGQQLMLFLGGGLVAQSAAHLHVVDAGLPAAGATGADWHPQWSPGVQSAAAFTPSGNVVIAWQDGTPVDLFFSTWSPAQNRLLGKASVRGAGAGAGFWPRVAVDAASGRAYLSSATLKATSATLPGNTLSVDTQPAQ
jgi:hypothetical protein